MNARLLAASALSLVTITAASQVAYGQPERPPRPDGGRGAQVTLAAPANLPAFTTPVPGSIQATAGAAAANAQATLSAVATDLRTHLQATLSALEIELPGALVIDSDGTSYTAEVTLTETQMNALLAAALGATGYAGASVDTVAGAVVVTLPNVTLSPQLSGTVSLTLSVTSVEGAVEVSIMQASVNGMNVPVALVEELVSELATGVFQAALDASLSSLNLDASVSYTVDSLVVTEDGVTLTVTVASSYVPTRVRP